MKNHLNILIPENTELINIAKEKYDELCELGSITISDHKMEYKELIREIEFKKYNALMIDSSSFCIDKNVIGRMNDKIKIISLNSTGYNNIDVFAAKKADIKVCNVPDYAGTSVAEMVFLMSLSLMRKIKYAEKNVRTGKWRKKDALGNELKGKTLGIIGFGHTGREVKKIAEAFGMNILINTIPEDGYEKNVDLEYLLSKSDIITLHVPLIDETRNMISNKDFEMMKNGVIIINTSRGGIVDEKALCDFILNEKVAGAGIDVYSNEPVEGSKHINNPLFDEKIKDRIILTPHSGFFTHEAIKKLFHVWCDNIINYKKNKPQNIVNL